MSDILAEAEDMLAALENDFGIPETRMDICHYDGDYSDLIVNIFKVLPKLVAEVKRLQAAFLNAEAGRLGELEGWEKSDEDLRQMSQAALDKLRAGN